MHLKKIKLAGFKSFVDPTLIPFKGNRTAIVGPNGCGKSNVIDAVRWVMGESSAKQLRGELMADVIFNGTTNRKPVGQASIELFFDNNKTMLTGEYAKYNEIAIRREINRDGMSNYYLNGARCRRKDIVDVFLGTGLGVHSYAIIEQGMIAQLIEAKPDELRAYFEEAAGISKYKERRRETQNRIRHTRDNLDRLNDIRVELEQQLKSLKRQANAANRYKKLKQQQRLLKAQLQALHWRAVNDQVIEQEANIRQQEISLEAKMAEVSKITSEIEKLRDQQTEASDIFHEVQARYYNQGADISRLEQQIQHNKERCVQLNKDLKQINENCLEVQQHINHDKHNIDQLNSELKNIEPRTLAAKQAANIANQELITAEQTMQKWQIARDNFNNEAAHNIKQAEVEKTKITHLQQGISNETQQLEKLCKEQIELPNIVNLTKEIATLKTDRENIKMHSETLKNNLVNKREQVSNQQKQISQLSAELNNAEHELQELHGRRVSLEVLQQVALGKNDEQIDSWLKQHRLENKPRLAQELQVETGWEKAVETVLGNHLNAICIDDIAAISNTLSNLKNGNLTLFDTKQKQSAINKTNTLADKIQSSWPVNELLIHVYTALTLSEALSLRSSLKSYESVITRDGIWLGPSWICMNFEKDENHGILQRKQELQELNKQIQTVQTVITNKEQLLQQVKTDLADLENQCDELQQKSNAASAKYSDNYGKLTAKQGRLEYLKQRAIILEQEITEHQQRITATQEQLAAIHTIWQQAEQNKLSDDKKRTILSAQRNEYQEKLQTAREKAKQTKQSVDQLTMQIEFTQNQLSYLQQSLQRAQSQIISLTERKQSITQLIKNIESPLDDLNKELEQSLEKRLAIENELAAAKQKAGNIEYILREAERNQATLQNEAQAIRSQLEQVRMEWKALQARCSAYEEQINEAGFELEAVSQGIPDTAGLTEWEEKLTNMARRIERLGPINLAAIGEYEQKQERKNYLDAQNDDLVEALTTLENAIYKIDRETRNRFKQTFDTVNNKFAELFPIVFGGGKACLEMTSDDLLSTGIEIIAQPPGKRNTTIHLLSGGEKALAAIALIFAIFQLNPAPFCMLDEVDAPLDDNNIIRFCNLVEEMSERIQFIIVTHNKTTMEMVEQLTGVTMQEAGVSRIVSVDIQEAFRYGKDIE